MGKIKFPLKLVDTEENVHNVAITTEAVHTDFPLLFGGNSIEKFGINARFAKRTIQLEHIPGLEGPSSRSRTKNLDITVSKYILLLRKLLRTLSTQRGRSLLMTMWHSIVRS